MRGAIAAHGVAEAGSALGMAVAFPAAEEPNMLHPLPLALLPLAQEAPAAVTGFGGTDGPEILPYLKICVILIVAIGGLAWGFKRFVAGNVRVRASRRSLQMLDVLPLGGKQRLVVVRCYDRTFALGLGDKEVTAIAELDPVVAAGEGAQDEGDATQPNGGADHGRDRTFQRALAHVQQALSKTRAGVGPAGSLGAQVAPVAKADRRTAVAQLLNAANGATNDAPVQQAAPAKRARRKATAATNADEAPRRTAPTKRATAKAATKAAARAVTKAGNDADAPTRRVAAKNTSARAEAPRATQPARRRPAAAERPASTPTLGLEGVMG